MYVDNVCCTNLKRKGQKLGKDAENRWIDDRYVINLKHLLLETYGLPPGEDQTNYNTIWRSGEPIRIVRRIIAITVILGLLYF